MCTEGVAISVLQSALASELRLPPAILFFKKRVLVAEFLCDLASAIGNLQRFAIASVGEPRYRVMADIFGVGGGRYWAWPPPRRPRQKRSCAVSYACPFCEVARLVLSACSWFSSCSGLFTNEDGNNLPHRPAKRQALALGSSLCFCITFRSCIFISSVPRLRGGPWPSHRALLIFS